MKFDYDAEVDAGYVTVNPTEIVAQTRIIQTRDHMVNIDLGESGNLLGVEIV